MSIINKKTIMDLIDLKQEGGYWDFKRQWYVPDNGGKGDLLHDIVCMANNLENHDAYIIIGVDEESDYNICGVGTDNRKNTADIIDFLRSKPFAHGIRPTVIVKTLTLKGVEVDVIVIHHDRHTPYYLTDRYNAVCPNHIYTRVQDVNTPKDGSAHFSDIEKLWKRRFGLDASIVDRFLILLDQYDQWECSWGNNEPAYHKVFPEFRIVEADFDDAYDGWEPQSVFYCVERTRFTPIKMFYHNTVIWKTGVMGLDNGNVNLPYSDSASIEGVFSERFMCGLYYHYYDLSKLSGKLLRIFIRPHELDCIDKERLKEEGYLRKFIEREFLSTHNGINRFLLFENDQERLSFEKFALEHHKNIDIDTFASNDKYKYALEHEERERILALLIASELFEQWKLTT